MNDTLIFHGGSVKALDDDGRIGGHLVVFGSADRPDITEQRDFFTADTDFWFDDAAVKRRVLYNHGLDAELGPIGLGDVELKTDKVGVWMEGQLKLRKEYEKKYGGYLEATKLAVKDGKLGLSSGSAGHLVRREKQTNGAHKVLSWPIIEASLTPTPGEPRTRALAIKSLAEFKGECLGPYAAQSAIGSALDSLGSMARYRIGDHLRDDKASRADKLAACKGCLEEHAAIAMKLIAALLDDAAPGEAAVKAILDGFGTGAGAPPEAFLDSCLKAVSDLEQGARSFAKVGPAKRQAIKSLRDALDGLLGLTRPDAAEIAAKKTTIDDLLTRLSR